MRSQVVRLLSLTEFDFSNVTSGIAISDVLLAPDIDMSDWGGGVLIVRVHALTMPVDTYITLDAYAVAPTCEDPSRVFRGPRVGSVKVASTAAAGQVYAGWITSGAGEAISLYLNLWQDKTGTCTFALSIDLVQREEAESWTPAELGTKLRLWLDEHDLAQSSGAYTDWGDQSPANLDFTQSNSQQQPNAGVTLNTWPSPDFDVSTLDYMVAANDKALSSFISASAYHLFVVIRADSIAGTDSTWSFLNDAVIADAGSGWWGLYLRTNSGTPQVLGFHWDSAQRVAVGTGYRATTDTLIEFSYDGTTLSCRVGNGTPATASGGGSIPVLTGVMNLGKGASGGLHLDGRIASVILCNEYLSAGDAAHVRAYLSSKYGVSA